MLCSQEHPKVELQVCSMKPSPAAPCEQHPSQVVGDCSHLCSVLPALWLFAGKNLCVFFSLGFQKCRDTTLDQKLVFLQLLQCRQCLILSSNVSLLQLRHLVLWSRCSYPWAPEQTLCKMKERISMCATCSKKQPV